MARLDERIVRKEVKALSLVLGGYFLETFVPFFKLFEVLGMEIL